MRNVSAGKVRPRAAVLALEKKPMGLKYRGDGLPVVMNALRFS
jgi:hypothetical protein